MKFDYPKAFFALATSVLFLVSVASAETAVIETESGKKGYLTCVRASSIVEGVKAAGKEVVLSAGEHEVCGWRTAIFEELFMPNGNQPNGVNEQSDRNQEGKELDVCVRFSLRGGC